MNKFTNSFKANSSLLFVVDMINGFTKEGALADQKINKITPTIIEYLNLIPNNVFVIDKHSADSVEFKAYPPHCINGSGEDEIVDELKAYAQQFINKNSTNTFFSKDFQANLDSYLAKYENFVLVGCCSDICILHFALSLQTYLNEHNLLNKVVVIEDAIATYDSDWHHADKYQAIAIDLMKQNGISVL